MGRTVPTFTNIIDSEISSWSKYRRGLRKEDQEVFDDVFRAARLHLAENFYAMRDAVLNYQLKTKFDRRKQCQNQQSTA